MNIMGIGVQEMLIILVGALLIFGPDRLPEVAGQIGKLTRDLRKMTGDLQGELERTAGVSDIKKAVQNELMGVKSTMDGATRSAKSTISSATSSAGSSSVKSTTGSTAAKSTTTSTAAKTTATVAKSAAPPPKPVASKKDPLADVSFWEEKGSTAAAPVIAAAAASTSKASSNGHSAGAEALASDAIGRARQRRMAAGYNNRRAS